MNVGTIHLIGIGGIGISGLAEILHNLGYKVSGSDVADSANVARVRKLGITVHIGHKAENIDGAGVVVHSSAVKKDNPEIVAARKAHIPVIKRAEMLAEICRLKATVSIAGTHGKTTTTTLTSAMFAEAGLDPTIINGGIINAYGTNAILGKGDWLVVEADESDGTFINIPSVIGVVTNIDPEHLDFWGDFDAVKNAFRRFVENLPFYGFAVMCNDHPVVRELIKTITDRRIISYGLEDGADLVAKNIRTGTDGNTYDVVSKDGTVLKDIFLPLPGLHNVQNSLAAIAVARELKFADAKIRSTLEKFSGVKRRFTKTGEVNGVTIIDDYAHHPKEILATLSAARGIQDARKGRVIAVLQPHRFTRVRDLFDDFAKSMKDADEIVLADIYTAGEAPIDGVTQATLSKRITELGGKKVSTFKEKEELAPLIQKIAKPGDMVVCMGAGSITYWAHELPDALAGRAGVNAA